MSAERPIALSLDHVGVSYLLKRGAVRHKRFWAIEDVSFDLYQGESLGVVGKNGAGKSTLLRMLAGIMTPDRGTLVNHGYSCSLLTLSLGFLPYLTGRENAIMSGMFHGLTKREVEAKMDAIVEFAELDEFMEQPLSTYSAGMRARLGFSVAFQVNPDILLVDELIGVGDQEFQDKSMRVMKERIRSQESTVVFVSHTAALIKELCDRCIWIEDRVLQAIGPTAEVLDQYIQYHHGAGKRSEPAKGAAPRG